MQAAGIFYRLVTDALAAGTVVRFTAEGTSMHPTIRDGELVTITPAAAGDVVRGDVVLYQCRRRMLAHRLIAVSACGAERRFHFRGDARAEADAPVGADALLGKVASVFRNGRATRLCGRGARWRHAARTLASRGRVFRSMIRALHRTGA
jgi:signal peptidase I